MTTPATPSNAYLMWGPLNGKQLPDPGTQTYSETVTNDDGTTTVALYLRTVMTIMGMVEYVYQPQLPEGAGDEGTA